MKRILPIVFVVVVLAIILWRTCTLWEKNHEKRSGKGGENRFFLTDKKPWSTRAKASARRNGSVAV
jgi:hypothetical protein